MSVLLASLLLASTLSGKVLLADGTPAVGAEVRIRLRTEESVHLEPGRLRPPATLLHTDAHGGFRAELPEESADVAVVEIRSADGEHARRVVRQLGDSRNVELGTLLLEDASVSAVLVRDTHGRPIGGAWAESQGVRSDPSDANGRLVLVRTARASDLVRVISRSHRPLTLRAGELGGTVELVLLPLTSLSIRLSRDDLPALVTQVRAPRVTRVKRYDLVVVGLSDVGTSCGTRDGIQIVRALGHEEGLVFLPDLVAGVPLEVLVLDATGRPISTPTTVTLVQGEQREVRMDIDDSNLVVFEGRAVNARGQALSDGSVVVGLGRFTEWGGCARLAADGGFRLTVGPGSFSLSFSLGLRMHGVTDVVVDPGSVREFVIPDER